MDFFREWGIVLNQFTHSMELVIAGLIGGWASAKLGRRKDDPPISRYDVCIFVITGGFCAYYLTGLVMRMLHIEDANMGAVSFLLGIFGGSFISAVLRMFQNADFWSVLADILRSRFGGK